MEANDSTISIPSVDISPFNQLIFRKTLLFYLKTNAQPRISLKLMQISRYFCYREFPYMVVEDLRHNDDGWEYLQFGIRFSNYQTLDLENLTKPLWITNALYLTDDNDSNFISQLISKTAVCDIKYLNIFGHLIKMNEFEFLISSNAVTEVSFEGMQVFSDDGSIVPVDEIFKLLPNLKRFDWTFTDTNVASEITPTSTAKLIEYINPSILNQFNFWDIPETFGFELFTEFMNENPSIFFRLSFIHEISDEYAKILQAYVDKLIETGEYKNFQILIEFPQRNVESYMIMESHFFLSLCREES